VNRFVKERIEKNSQAIPFFDFDSPVDSTIRLGPFLWNLGTESEHSQDPFVRHRFVNFRVDDFGFFLPFEGYIHQMFIAERPDGGSKLVVRLFVVG